MDNLDSVTQPGGFLDSWNLVLWGGNGTLLGAEKAVRIMKVPGEEDIQGWAWSAGEGDVPVPDPEIDRSLGINDSSGNG